MISLLLLGFVIGMRHALEADHLAAMATLATRSSSWRHACAQGVVWGLGHTLTLFFFGALVLVLDTVVPERLAQGLELAVGMMLALLGLDVLRRLLHERVHFHIHRHSSGIRHFHAHAHAPHQAHDADRHDHIHAKGFPYRALCIGLMHGMAGSAALILLTLQSTPSIWQGLAYMALFGIGSMIGMALLSLVIVLPLRYSARGMSGLQNGLQAAIGCTSTLLGGVIVYNLILNGSLA